MNMMKTRILTLTAICLALSMTTVLTGCTAEEVPASKEQQEDISRISFTFEGWTGIAEHPTEITRAATATTSDITTNGFGVSASIYAADGSYTTAGSGSYFHNVHAYPEVEMDYFWPAGSHRMSFFAYYPYENAALTLSSAPTHVGYPVYSYTVPQSVTAQTDFMTAEVLNITATPTDTPVPLTFQHQCTDIRFSVTNQHPENTIKVKSITMVGMKYAGTSEGGTWTLTGAANTTESHPFTFTANADIDAEETVDVTGTTNHFIVLPQTIAAATTFLVVKTTEYGAERTYTHVLPENLTLEKAKSYTFHLTLGDGELIVDPDTDVNDWDAVVQNLTQGGTDVNDPDGQQQTVGGGNSDVNPQDPEKQEVGTGGVNVNDWQ